MLISTLSFAQETAKSSSFTPLSTCTKAMGVSKEKCKKICTSKKATTASANDNKVANAKLVAQKTNVNCNPKNCDPVACAKACGMSVAECQKICGSKAETQKAVDAKLVAQKTPAKKCCAVKCCKKGLARSAAVATDNN